MTMVLNLSLLVCQVMGDDLKTFLTPLRVSKIKLVTAYVEQAQAQRCAIQNHGTTTQSTQNA